MSVWHFRPTFALPDGVSDSIAHCEGETMEKALDALVKYCCPEKNKWSDWQILHIADCPVCVTSY